MTAFNEEFRFGSSHWADDADQRPFRRSPGFYVGLDERARILRHPNDGPAIMIAGPGAGKAVSGGLMFNACAHPGSILIVDLKGEIAAVSLAAQAALGKYAYCVNPAGLLKLPNHSTDPLDILSGDSATLVADAKMISEMLVPLSGTGNGKYFEEKARLLLEAILLVDADSATASLLGLYRALNALDGDAETANALLKRMAFSVYEHVRSAAGEILWKTEHAPKEWSAILSEARKSMSWMDVPSFQSSLQEPDFSLRVLCERPCNVYLNIPAEYVGIWSPYLRLLIGVAMLYKQRNPQAPRVVFMIDEASQLGKAEFLMRAMTFGRGGGIQTQVVFQSYGQLIEHYGNAGAQTFLASAVIQQWFGARDLETAERLSRTIGNETLSYDADLEQAAARKKKAEIVRELMAGADPFAEGLNYAQQERAAMNRVKMQRPLLTHDEVLRIPNDRQVILAPGISPPIAAWRRPYFMHRELVGKFMPNPYFRERDGYVRIRTLFRRRWARVITEPVPEKFAEYPQYKDGSWQYIEGYRPN